MEKSKEVFVKTESIKSRNESEKIKDKLRDQREKHKIIEKYKNVKSLADSDDDEDAAEWFNKMKQIQEEKEHQKALARKKARLLEEMDDEFESNAFDTIKKKEKLYTSKDLKGLAIGHKVDSIKEGQQVVLTLRDNDVLNEDEDVLENVNMIDDEKATKNIDNKTKKPDYKPYDDDEFDEFGILKKSSLLSKYDEEIEGPKNEVFRIGQSRSNVNTNVLNSKVDIQGKMSLSLPEFKVASEYYTPEEMVKFKKPSKRKAGLRKRTKIEKKEDLPQIDNSEMHTDHGSRSSRSSKNKKGKPEIKRAKIELDINKVNEEIDNDINGPDEDLTGIRIEEDDAEKELHSALNKTRKLKLRDNKDKFVDPAINVAKIVGTFESVKQENPGDEDSILTFESSNANNIILNATAEFCRNLGDLPKFENRSTFKVDDVDMEFEEHIPEDFDMDGDEKTLRNNWNEIEDQKNEEEDNDDDQEDNGSKDNSPGIQERQPILEEEPDASVGIAGALKLAMNKGYLDKEAHKPVGAPPTSSIISAEAYAIEEKFRDDDRGGRRDRYSGHLMEFKEKHNYRPDFKLDYVDEKGIELNQKEAFRYLSHKFHGKGPGKNKVDKRMKKLEQESKLRQMSSIDTPLNTLKLLQEKQKELQAPYIVLTGQKTNAPNLTRISKKK